MPFEVSGHVIGSYDYEDIGLASKIEVYGKMSSLPIFNTGAGHYSFTDLSVSKVNIANMSIITPSQPKDLADLVTIALATGPASALNNEQVVISALVHQLGGVVGVSAAEMEAARRYTLKAERLVAPDRFIISTEAR